MSLVITKYKYLSLLFFAMPIDDFITHPEIHKKGWGRELWIANGNLYCSKILEIIEGKQCSIHYHKLKDETFYILEGRVRMELYYDPHPAEPTTVIMMPNDTVHIPKLLAHRFYGLEDSKILEVSTQHFEEDSYRILKGD